MGFGIDPELFVMKKGGRLATSIHLLEGFEPQTSFTASATGAVTSKMDGFAFEFESHPTGCRDYLFPAIANGIQDFHKAHPDYKLSAKASMKLTQRSVAGTPPEGVCEYGCVPDRDGYELIEKTPEFESYQTMDRFTGGHIHWAMMGYQPQGAAPREQRVAALALMLDAYVAVPLVAAIGEINDYGEALRRTYYGQAGSHRVKPYGIEYRVLSGMFLSTPFITTWALGAVRKTSALLLMQNMNRLSSKELRAAVKRLFKSHRLDEVQDIINNHDVKAARAYFNKLPKNEQYSPEFITGMIRADKAGVGINMNLMESWNMEINSPRARHHDYPGVEKMLKTNEKRVTNKQFAPRQLMTLQEAGW